MNSESNALNGMQEPLKKCLAEEWTLGKWSAELFEKILLIPNRVTTDTNSFVQIVRALQKNGFTRTQAERAEKWIMTSPEAFKFRGASPKLEYQDFYNTGITHTKPTGEAYRSYVNTLAAKQSFMRRKRFMDLVEGDEVVLWDAIVNGQVVLCDVYVKTSTGFESSYVDEHVEVNQYADTEVYIFDVE